MHMLIVIIIQQVVNHLYKTLKHAQQTFWILMDSDNNLSMIVKEKFNALLILVFS